MKKCSNCNLEKERDDFYKSSRSKDGVGAYCKFCDSMLRKNRRLKNLSREKEHKKEYWKMERERFLHKMREYYKNNKDKSKSNMREWANKNREHLNEYHRKWRAETRKGQVHGHIRRQRKRNAGGDGVSSEQWIGLCNRYGNKCLCCGEGNVKLTLDHVIPLSKNGIHDISNIQPLCSHCNSVKGIKTIDYRT